MNCLVKSAWLGPSLFCKRYDAKIDGYDTRIWYENQMDSAEMRSIENTRKTNEHKRKGKVL